MKATSALASHSTRLVTGPAAATANCLAGLSGTDIWVRSLMIDSTVRSELPPTSLAMPTWAMAWKYIDSGATISANGTISQARSWANWTTSNSTQANIVQLTRSSKERVRQSSIDQDQNELESMTVGGFL